MKSISNTLRLFAAAIVFMVSTAATVAAQDKTSSDKAILSYSVCANDLETAKKIADELKALAIHGGEYTVAQFQKDMQRQNLYALVDKQLK